MKTSRFVVGVLFIALCLCNDALGFDDDDIVIKAFGNYGERTGLSCKRFAQTKVAEAGGILDSGYYWVGHAGHSVVSFKDLEPGDIVQSYDPAYIGTYYEQIWEYLYHTMIFVAKVPGESNVITVIDANFCGYDPGSTVGKVCVHDIDVVAWPAQFPGDDPIAEDPEHPRPDPQPHRMYFYRLGSIFGEKLPGMLFNESCNQEEWDHDISTAIMLSYVDNGGREVIGDPYDNGGGPYAHSWYCSDGSAYVVIQDLYDPLTGEYFAIVYNSYLNEAFLLQGGFRWQYLNNPDAPKRYSMPCGDEVYDWQDRTAAYGPQGRVYPAVQEFDLVVFLWDGYNIIVKNKTVGIAIVPGEEDLTIMAWPASGNHNVIDITGGPVCDYLSILGNGSEIAQTTLLEFVHTNLSPGDVWTYQVRAMSASGEVLASSNEVTVVSPGVPGEFTLQGAPEGWNSVFLQWQNTAYPYAPFLLLIGDGVQIAKLVSGFSQWTVYPLEPNHSYTYQLVAITASGLVLGYSNPVTVTTGQAPPPPPPEDPVPSLVQIQVEPTWLFATDGWATVTVYDQFGNEMPGVRVLFFSSNPNVFVISGDNGFCIANNIGTAEVWAEVYDRRWIQSERVTVSVVEEIPPEPDVFWGHNACGPTRSGCG